MEEAPHTLKEHFVVVDDFFKKTFREECKFFLGLKTAQYSEARKVDFTSAKDGVKKVKDIAATTKEGDFPVAIPATSVIDGTKHPVLLAFPTEKNSGKSSTSPMGTANFFAISPRLQFLTNGDTLGKLKVISGLTIPKMCHLEQDVLLASNGMIRGQMKVLDLMEGLKMTGRIGLNTISSAAEDISSVGLSYLRSDMFSSLLYQRNGLGSSNVAVDFGSKFLNLLVGAGFERERLSFLEAASGVEEIKAMYVGGGFTGLNWSIGAKFTHVNGVWGNGRVAMMQKLRPSTTVACSYDLDVAKAAAIISLGFSQGMLLRLPYFLSPSNCTSQWHPGASSPGKHPRVSPASEVNSSSGITVGNEYCRANSSSIPLVFPLISHVPLVFALKAESTGKISGTVRTIFNNSIRCGLVAHYNVLWKNSKPRLGFIISLEQEAS